MKTTVGLKYFVNDCRNNKLRNETIKYSNIYLLLDLLWPQKGTSIVFPVRSLSSVKNRFYMTEKKDSSRLVFSNYTKPMKVLTKKKFNVTGFVSFQ